MLGPRSRFSITGDCMRGERLQPCLRLTEGTETEYTNRFKGGTYVRSNSVLLPFAQMKRPGITAGMLSLGHALPVPRTELMQRLYLRLRQT